MTETGLREIEDVLADLRAAVKESGKTHREIEREMGLSAGYLVHLLSGSKDLRVRELMQICNAVSLSPARFFEPNEDHATSH